MPRVSQNSSAAFARRTRRRAKRGGGEETASWLVSYSDVMTLLLTFFVLLLSMAVIDELARREVVGSINRQFPIGGRSDGALTGGARKPTLDPGAVEGPPGDDLAMIKDTLFDKAKDHLHFQENRYVQIVSLSSDVLFAPGGTVLSKGGMDMLDSILPYLQKIQYPLLIAGHAALRREEEGRGYLVRQDDTTVDSTWPLSYRRALSVYRYLLQRGIGAGRLTIEAFGEYHPRFSNNTPEGRRKNRRVDLVLDKRNMEWIRKVEALREKEPAKTEMYYKGLRFDFSLPPASGSGASGFDESLPISPFANDTGALSYPSEMLPDAAAPTGQGGYE